jgi:glycosyltransferase involved in cell wall biosynthesis
VCRFEHVPEPDLQLWHRAADVAVLPYRGILNSGAFKLAETFGLPIVAPRAGNLADDLDPAYACGFDPDAPGDLLRALEDAVDLVTDPVAAARATAAARARATAYPPPRMAADFADVMVRRSGVAALESPGAADAPEPLVTTAPGESLLIMDRKP